MRRAAGATPDANGRGVDFDQKARRKRTCAIAGDALRQYIQQKRFALSFPSNTRNYQLLPSFHIYDEAILWNMAGAKIPFHPG
jgi:hypothetical protein